MDKELVYDAGSGIASESDENYKLLDVLLFPRL